MKKFIIAICGILMIGTAMCDDKPDRWLEPKKTDLTSWWDKGTNYQTNITDFYPAVKNELSDDKPSTRHGTWDDEGAIIIWAAREIYEHGAKFCPVQIQAANENRETFVWLDYYWRNDTPAWKNCTTVCVKGYTGSNCSITGHGACPTKTPKVYPLQGKFTNLPDWKSLRREIQNTNTDRYTGETYTTTNYVETGDTYRKTESMTVISYQNGEGSEDSNRNATHIVLGAVNKVENGVMIAPIQIIGRRTKTGGGLKSWIRSAQSNGNGKLLCFDGYIPDSENKNCIKDPQCGTAGTNSTDNYADGSESTTASCGTGKDYERYGANTAGICLDCWEEGKNKIYSKIKKQCVNAHAYSKKKMQYGQGDESAEVQFQCWLKIDPDEFCECVTGEECKR